MPSSPSRAQAIRTSARCPAGSATGFHDAAPCCSTMSRGWPTIRAGPSGASSRRCLISNRAPESVACRRSASSPARPAQRRGPSILVSHAEQDLPAGVVVIVHEVPRRIVELVLVLVGEIAALEREPELFGHLVLQRCVEVERRIVAVGVGSRLLARHPGQIPAAIRAGDPDTPPGILVIQCRARGVLREPRELARYESGRTGLVLDRRCHIGVVHLHAEIAQESRQEAQRLLVVQLYAVDLAAG